jgi:hypothetical protein
MASAVTGQPCVLCVHVHVCACVCVYVGGDVCLYSSSTFISMSVCVVCVYVFVRTKIWCNIQ